MVFRVVLDGPLTKSWKGSIIYDSACPKVLVYQVSSFYSKVPGPYVNFGVLGGCWVVFRVVSDGPLPKSWTGSILYDSACPKLLVYQVSSLYSNVPRIRWFRWFWVGFGWFWVVLSSLMTPNGFTWPKVCWLTILTWDICIFHLILHLLVLGGCRVVLGGFLVVLVGPHPKPFGGSILSDSACPKVLVYQVSSL